MKPVFAKKAARPDPELLTLKAELLEAQGDLAQAYRQFDQALDPELVESCVYQISAVKARCNYLIRAIKERSPEAAGEVPVGCVIVRDGEIVGRGRNRREEKQATASHAEMEAIAQANEHLGTWRLDDCELYVTLEPCPMCAGAILNARIRRVWYGARDEAFGACGGVTNLFMESFPNRPALVGGILGEDCRRVLADFFAGLRGGEKNRPSDLI